MHFFKVSNETRPAGTQQVNMALHLGSLIIKRGPTCVPGREAFNFYFQLQHSLLQVSLPFSLMIRADVQCMFDGPQIGYFSQHNIQVNSCVSQNDFPRLQQVKISFISKHFLPLPPTPTTLQKSLQTKLPSLTCARDHFQLPLSPQFNLSKEDDIHQCVVRKLLNQGGERSRASQIQCNVIPRVQ